VASKQIRGRHAASLVYDPFAHSTRGILLSRACIVFYLEIILFNSSNYLLQADGEYVCSTGTRHTDSKHAGRGVFGLCFTRVGSTTLTIDDGESGTFKHLLDLSLNKAYWACKALLSPYHHQRNGMHILYALIQTMRNSIHKF